MPFENVVCVLKNIYSEYKDTVSDQKIIEFIQKELPERLDSHIERTQRYEKLELGTEAFINEFLINSDTKYMYIDKSNIFIKYDGSEFKLVNESDILHNILTGISHSKILLPWKYKIKNMIIKKIKETSLFNTIPESKTIQTILNNFTPFIFNTKEESKYFLTVLGDNVLKKKQDNVYLIDIKAKDFITALSDNIFGYFKNKYHIDTTIKYSWYEHPYKNCRIIDFNDTIQNTSGWNTFVKYHILDIMAIAVHYSNRFECADKFAESVIHNPNILKARYLIDNDENSILKDFIQNNILKIEDTTTKISINEMHYLWKRYLSNKGIPSVVFMSHLDRKLSKYIPLVGEHYIGVTSVYLGNSEQLRDFWSDYMEFDKDEEIEITELYNIYKEWSIENGKVTSIIEKGFLSILEHFYAITLNDYKYIKNYRCLLWNKKEEMQIILNDLKITYKFSPDCFEKSIDVVYKDYCLRCKTKFNYKAINKHEFKKYINQIIPDKYIIRNRILNDYWKSTV